MAKWGIRHKRTGELLGQGATCDGCGNVEYEIDMGPENIWFSETAIRAEFERRGLSRPDEYEIVRIAVVSSEDDIKIPTFDEFIQMKYNDVDSPYYDQAHYEYIVKEIKKSEREMASRVPIRRLNYHDVSTFFGDSRNKKVLEKYGYTEWKKYGYEVG